MTTVIVTVPVKQQYLIVTKTIDGDNITITKMLYKKIVFPENDKTVKKCVW